MSPSLPSDYPALFYIIFNQFVVLLLFSSYCYFSFLNAVQLLSVSQLRAISSVPSEARNFVLKGAILNKVYYYLNSYFGAKSAEV